jgi:dTDP-4-dehydrorhamnose reductase
MKCLIVGGSSLLGRYLALTKPADIDAEYTWFTNHIDNAIHLDICVKSQVLYVLERVKPDLIIHLAAQGSVDYAESHFNEAHYVNVIGLQNVLEAGCGIPLVYISTNAVFGGDHPPYSETSKCWPINKYGSIKREAELKVMASPNWMIIRPFLLYGYPYPGGRQNWLTTILSKLEKGETVRLVDDTFWQPTSAEDCAAAIWSIVAWGGLGEIYHVASDDRMTLYEFGQKIATEWGYDAEMVQPISSRDLSIAPRPKDTTFDLGKIHAMGLRLKCVEEGLRAMK